jgi:hypothetical protein
MALLLQCLAGKLTNNWQLPVIGASIEAPLAYRDQLAYAKPLSCHVAQRTSLSF